MRKWQDLAAPDDPGSWYGLSCMWPTKRGTYETADFSSGSVITGPTADYVTYAFTGGGREFVVDSSPKIWEYTAGSLTNRTNGTAGGVTMMAQYGSVTIACRGTSNPTTFSTATTFSALAGAPNGVIVVVQSNAVLIFNTAAASDGWAASDVGDYTNWATGEAASGRIIDTPGAILGAVAYGPDVMVFKQNAIYRMTYVGGTVKWQIQQVWNGAGLAVQGFTIGAPDPRYQLVSTAHGVAFKGDSGSAAGNVVYLFDGASAPRPLNTLTSLPDCYPVFVYDPVEDMLVLAPAWGSGESGAVKVSTGVTVASVYYYYNFQSGMWGSGLGGDSENNNESPAFVESVNGVLQGDYYARAESKTKPVYWRSRTSAGVTRFQRSAPTAPTSTAVCHLETMKFGMSEAKTVYDQLIPQLRRRTDLGSGTAAAALVLFREREDTTATVLRAITESTQRKRFDLLGGGASDNFARIKVTWTGLDVEVDDFKLATKSGGRN